MKHFRLSRSTFSILFASIVTTLMTVPYQSTASTGGGGYEVIRVSKCFTNATKTSSGQLLIKAASSNSSAHLSAYRPDGTYQGVVQNGGGSRYGGTVMGFLPNDPGYMVIVSSGGATVSAKTTAFQP